MEVNLQRGPVPYNVRPLHLVFFALALGLGFALAFVFGLYFHDLVVMATPSAVVVA